MVTLRAQIISSQVDPSMRDRLRRWLVTARVREVLEGTLEPDRDEISLLVHSPAREFADADIVGREYVLTLEDPVSDPYNGPLSVKSDD